MLSRMKVGNINPELDYKFKKEKSIKTDSIECFPLLEEVKTSAIWLTWCFPKEIVGLYQYDVVWAPMRQLSIQATTYKK